MENSLETVADAALLKEIERRFQEKSASITEMEFLTKKMIALNEQAKESEALQSMFLSLVQNEFNNPMSVLLLLSKKTLASSSDGCAESGMLHIMRQELLRLDFQLANIFSVTEIESGDISNHIEYIDIEETYSEVIDKLHYMIDEKNIEMIFKNKIVDKFASDSSKLEQIILNVLSNAVHFSFNDQKVITEVFIEDEKVHITVEDSGEGIKQVHKADIYNRFSQFHAGEARTCSGLGLGLSVVRAYIDTLDGSIDFESKENYTKFLITLPLIDAKSDMDIASDDVFFDDFDDDDTMSM